MTKAEPPCAVVAPVRACQAPRIYWPGPSVSNNEK